MCSSLNFKKKEEEKNHNKGPKGQGSRLESVPIKLTRKFEVLASRGPTLAPS